ncbi:MAG TPA: hypothetical protein P5123_06955 [Spirochaetota bacterium]|nr:hypothetical protein [Spirochaetota bacterium]
MKQIRIIMCAAIVLFSAEILPVEYDEGYLLETPESYYGRIEYLPTLKKINYIRGAVVRNRDVFISWIKLEEKDVVYTIYRNTRVMDTYMAFESAIAVGEVTDRESFLDTSIRESGVYYYAVTTKKSGYAEDKNLKAYMSYLPDGFTVRTGVDHSTVYSIDAKRYSDGIVISWKNPYNYKGNLFVYRSTDVIDSSEALNKAVMIKKTDNVETYRDRNASRNFYYAVLMEGPDNRPARIFSPRNNFTGRSSTFSTELPSNGNARQYLNASIEGGRAALSWRIPRGKYLLFKSSTRPETRRDARRGQLLKRFDSSLNYYYDNSGDSNSFYSIVPENRADDTRMLVEGIDMVFLSSNKAVEPKIKSGTEVSRLDDVTSSDVSADSIDRLVKEFYRTKNYKPIIRQLLKIASGSSNEPYRAKAYFFAGRIIAEQGDYRMALNYLYRDDVLKYYPKEAKFWQDYCLTKLE